MPHYHVVFGAFVRMYADHAVEADTDDAARARAIADFRAGAADFAWLDANYDNLALPSIVTLQRTDPPADIIEHHDFALTSADARQYAADKMLVALEFVQMTLADLETSKCKGYLIRCRKLVGEALAQATFPDGLASANPRPLSSAPSAASKTIAARQSPTDG